MRPRHRLVVTGMSLLALGSLAVWILSGADTRRDQSVATSSAGHEKHELGLLTSLPLYWPVGADFASLIDGAAGVPWPREFLELRHELRLLDTLSPITGLSPEEPPMDPLSGLGRLAIIQPRGLSPADNVALDDWVRGGGRLLYVLDPALTGHYDVALGDPDRPVASAVVPPVIARWGLAVSFDESQEASVRTVSFGEGILPLALAGSIERIGEAGKRCELVAERVIARCPIGDGRVTVVADAGIFEHSELAGPRGEYIAAVFRYAYD